MTLKAAEFQRIVTKLKLETRNGRDTLAWFVYNGKVIVRTRCSHGSGDVPFPHAIRQQLKLDEEQFRLLRKCTLTRDDFVQILRDKGYIALDEQEQDVA